MIELYAKEVENVCANTILNAQLPLTRLKLILRTWRSSGETQEKKLTSPPYFVSVFLYCSV